MEDFKVGVHLVFSSFGAVSQLGKSRVYAYIIIIGLLLVASIFSLWGVLEQALFGFLQGLLPQMHGFWHSAISASLGFFATFVSLALLVVFLASVGGCVALVILSPVLTSLADAAWTHYAPRSMQALRAPSLLPSIVRAVGVALKNAVKQLLVLFLVFVSCSMLPLSSVVLPVLTFLVNAYFYGVSLTDYAMEHAEMSARQSAAYSSSRRALFIGLGAPFALCLLVPFLGQVIAIFLVPATVVAGVRAVLSHGDWRQSAVADNSVH